MKRFLGIAAVSALLVALLAYRGAFSALLSSNYLPHRYCYLAQQGLVWTNVAMDSLIAASYGLIFGCLFWVASKLRALEAIQAYLWIFIAFGIFILACGVTHVMEVVTVWWPVYPLSAAVKVVCAAASVPTAVLFARATPAISRNIRRFVEMLSTTQHEKEQALTALIAAEKLAVAGRISTSISHEIRSPLQAAGDLLYLLAGDTRLPGDMAETMRTAASELERANLIAQSTLSLYRGSSEASTVSLAEIAQSVLDLQLPDLVRRHISLQRRLRTPVALKAYPGELRQILINLIQNAVAAIDHGELDDRECEDGGRILVRIQPRQSPAGSRPGYSITVADNGPGIAAPDRSRIFTMFFTTKGEQGTGMGLWLVRSMVEKQGGCIHFRSRTLAESNVAGTIFNIWIPLEPAPLSQADSASLVGRLLAEDKVSARA